MAPLLVLTLLCGAYQAVVYLYIFRGALAADGDHAAARGGVAPVSLIVCYRNEARKLGSCVPALLAQDHPDFELLLVDDHSTDGSADLAAALTAGDPRVRRLRPPGPTRPGKKDALGYGIAAARHERLLLTDADCQPAGPDWLRRMTAPLAAADYELVLGAAPYAGGASFLHRWQRFEATYTALQYLGYARRGRPYMGVGRNLAYCRSLYRRAGGFAAHADRAGGDDDLLVNAAARPRTTARVTDPAAWTYSAPSDSWAAYLRRKFRHHSVGAAYDRGTQLRLGLLALTHGLFYLSLLGLFLAGYWGAALAGLLPRWALVLATYGPARVREFARIPVAFPLIGDALLGPYYLVTACGAIFATRRW